MALLFGNTSGTETVNENAGEADGTFFTVLQSGTVKELTLHLSTAGATQLEMGVASGSTTPEVLKTSATLASPKPGVNTVNVTPLAVTAGEKLWLVFLPLGGKVEAFYQASGTWHFKGGQSSLAGSMGGIWSGSAARGAFFEASSGTVELPGAILPVSIKTVPLPVTSPVTQPHTQSLSATRVLSMAAKRELSLKTLT